MTRPPAAPGRRCAVLLLATLVPLLLPACRPAVEARSDPESEREGIPAVLTGIDHLPEHLSIQQFFVDGAAGSRAGGGGSNMCCVLLRPWRTDLQAKVRWAVTNWRDRTYYWREESVPIEVEGPGGDVKVHFLPDGTVRVIASAQGPGSPTYPGPRLPQMLKNPWEKYADGPLAIEIEPHLSGSPP